jgi:hypothetical protein
MASEKTFIIVESIGLITSVLADMLEKRGLRRITNLTNDIKYIDYIFEEKNLINGKWKYAIPYTIKSFMKSVLQNYDSIYSKELLYTNMMKYAKSTALKHMAYSVNINDFIKLIKTDINELRECFGDVVIIKPVDASACSGKGIYIIEIDYDNPNYINILINKIEEIKLVLSNFKSVVVCKYITNPLLFKHVITHKMVKCHLRIHLMIKIIDGVISHSVCNKGYISHAYEEYKTSDYDNKRIHDTHGKSTTGVQIFPDNLDKTIDVKKHIFKQILTICDKITMIASKQGIKVYEESKNGYVVFGLDFLVQDEKDNYNVNILEVNTWLGNNNQILDIQKNENINTRFIPYSKYYYSWLLKNIM